MNKHCSLKKLSICLLMSMIVAIGTGIGSAQNLKVENNNFNHPYFFNCSGRNNLFKR